MAETDNECPNCGADVPRAAKACPECGSCPETGWSEGAYTDRLGLPDLEFNYNRFIEEEFSARPGRTRGRHVARWGWWLVALLLLVLVTLGVIL